MFFDSYSLWCCLLSVQVTSKPYMQAAALHGLVQSDKTISTIDRRDGTKTGRHGTRARIISANVTVDRSALCKLYTVRAFHSIPVELIRYHQGQGSCVMYFLRLVLIPLIETNIFAIITLLQKTISIIYIPNSHSRCHIMKNYTTPHIRM